MRMIRPNTANTNKWCLCPVANQGPLPLQLSDLLLCNDLANTHIKSPNHEPNKKTPLSISTQVLVPLPHPLFVYLAFNPNLPNSPSLSLAEAAEHNGLGAGDTFGDLHERSVVIDAVGVAVADADLWKVQVEVWVQGPDVDFPPAVGFGAGKFVVH